MSSVFVSESLTHTLYSIPRLSKPTSMATSLRLFSSFSSAKAASLMPKSSPTLTLYCSPANLRMVRTVTSAAVSSNEAPQKRAPRGIMKPRPVSPEMQDLVGVPEISRTQALKQIWAHIKEHNLQVFFPFHFLSFCKLCLVFSKPFWWDFQMGLGFYFYVWISLCWCI